MKNFLQRLPARLKLLGGSILTIYTLVCVQNTSFGQASNAPINKITRLSTVTHSNLEVTSSKVLSVDQFSSKDNLKNNTNGATWVYAIGGSAWIEVKDNSATGTEVYKEGSYAGFVVDAAAVDILSNITIETYLGSEKKETKSSASLISVTGVFSGAARIGFWTTKKTGGGNNDFDRIRIEYSALGVAGSRTVYYAEVIRYGAGPTLSCNTPTAARLSASSDVGFPVSIVADRTGVSGTCIDCTVSDRISLIDADPATSAKITMAVGVSADASISVGTVGQTNPIGTFVGFDISNPNLLGVGVASGIRIETYLNGVATNDFITGASLLNVSSAVVAGSERKVVGFKAAAAFDEVRLTVTQTGVNLGTTNVYGLVLTSFCNDAALSCNTPTAAKIPTNSVYVDGRHTGVTSAACVGCAISNPDYAIDNNTSTAASFVTVLNGIATGSFAVSNALTTYGENSFAGFDIETKSLAGATLLGTATIELLLNGVVVGGSSSGALTLGVNSSLLNGTNRQTIGVVAKTGVTYNGVKITFDKGVGVDLGDIKIYGAVFQSNCAGTEITCGQSVNLNLPTDPPVTGEPNFPVVIDIARTGYVGTACVGCFVNNASNVISPSKTDYAELGNVLNGIGRSSLSVYNPINTYPTGAVAGFTVRKDNFLVAATLFDQITIRTFNNGTQQEEMSGNSLLNLTVTLQIFGTASEYYNVGFITTKPFDEIQISVGSLVGLTDHYLKVYGAYIDTRTASVGTLRCFNTNPDNNVALKGVQINGNVSTNDIVATGTTYGTPVANSSLPNPGSEVPVMNADGSYTFLSSTTGVYSFNIPVCVAGQPTCFTESLTITVLDETRSDNLPVANDDVIIVKGDATTTVPVLANVLINDGPGNNNGTLQTPTIKTGPGHGVASIVSGKVSYTPTAGFYGEDVITYEVCESPSGLCTTAILVITVLAPDAPNSLIAADDYITTSAGNVVNVTAANGVLANDKDPDGGGSITADTQNTTVTGVGTLVLNADGSYQFTPVPGFKGSAAFVYTARDNQGYTQKATLYILTEDLPDLDPVILIDASNFTSAISQRDFLVKIQELAGIPTISPVTFRVNCVSGFEMTVPGVTLSNAYQSGVAGSSAVNGTTTHENEQWMFKQDGKFIVVTSKEGKFVNSSGSALLGFHLKRNSGVPVNTTQNITVTIVAGSGGETDFTDNITSTQVKAE